MTSDYCNCSPLTPLGVVFVSIIQTEIDHGEISLLPVSNNTFPSFCNASITLRYFLHTPSLALSLHQSRHSFHLYLFMFLLLITLRLCSSPLCHLLHPIAFTAELVAKPQYWSPQTPFHPGHLTATVILSDSSVKDVSWQHIHLRGLGPCHSGGISLKAACKLREQGGGWVGERIKGGQIQSATRWRSALTRGPMV